MIFLRSLTIRDRATMDRGYPFDLPFVENLDEIVFDSPVTFFVGENGTGKSTLLEALAVAARRVVVGGKDFREDPTLEPVRRLADHLTLSWRKRTARGFFLRAEDFFNFASRIATQTEEFDAMAEFFGEVKVGDWWKAQAIAKGQGRALTVRYGDLHARSHGESFLHLFGERFVPGGLYLLDEPDTALSPQRQLAFLSMLKEMVAEDAQFVIATHSPIVLAFPEAMLLRFDGQTVAPAEYDDIENVRLTRDFLANPEAFLRHL